MVERDLLLETIAVYDRLGAKYADKIAHVRLPQLQEFVAMLPQGARVLDVGCAAGRDSAILYSAGFEVTGIDLSEQLLKLARERVVGVKFQRMDARKLDLGPDTFDGVWAHAVLLNQDRSEIRRILWGFWRILKPGGVCYLGVKEGNGERFIGESLVDNMKRRETYFQKPELKDLLTDAGLEIVKSETSGDLLGRDTTRWLAVFSKKLS